MQAKSTKLCYFPKIYLAPIWYVKRHCSSKMTFSTKCTIHVSDETSSITSCEFSQPSSGCDIKLQTNCNNVQNVTNYNVTVKETPRKTLADSLYSQNYFLLAGFTKRWRCRGNQSLTGSFHFNFISITFTFCNNSFFFVNFFQLPFDQL